MTQRSSTIVTVALAGVLFAAPARAEYKVKPVDVTQVDRREAMRDRPLIFGIGLIWDGRSTVYKTPEVFNPLLRERAEAAGITCARWGFDWAMIEEEPLEHDWEAAEKEGGLQRLLDMDIEVVGLINTVPAWASPEFKPGTYAPVEDPEVAELFEAFCTELAKRYRGRIRYYQYGHGQDIDFGWLPKADPVAYARWFKRAYRALKAGDPDCIVGTGGHMGRSTDFLKVLYEHGLAEGCDAVALCPGPAPEEHAQGDRALDWRKIEDYRQVMVEHGDAATPMWCPEYGWPFEVVGPDNQRDYMARALDYFVHYEFITLAVYLSLADWHRGDAGLFGLLDKDLNPRPGYTVWPETVKPLREAVQPRLTSRPAEPAG